MSGIPFLTDLSVGVGLTPPNEISGPARLSPPTNRMQTEGGPRVVLDSMVELLANDLKLWAERISLLDTAVVGDPKPGRLLTVLLALKRKWREAERDVQKLKITQPEKRSTLVRQVRSHFSEMERTYDRVYAE